MQHHKPIHIGFIGAGTMGMIHMETFRKVQGAANHHVVDVSLDRALDAARRFNIPNYGADASVLIHDPDIDAVVISVPNAFHAEFARQALLAGKHVLLEKPMAMNADEAEEVLKAQQQSGKLLMIGHQMRWKWPFPEIRKQIAEGRLGEIYYVRAGWMRRKGIPGWGSAYTSRKMMGGGAAVDIGVHMIDLARYLIGPKRPVSVSGGVYGHIGRQGKGIGTWGTVNPQGSFDVDDLAAAMIRFEDGTLLNLEVSWAAFTDAEENGPYLHIMGSQGGLSIRESGGTWLTECFDQSVDIPILQPQDGIEDERVKLAEHFLSCIREGKEPLVSGRDGWLNQKLLDAIYESALSGRETILVLN
mgnify:CR=1 FL=1